MFFFDSVGDWVCVVYGGDFRFIVLGGVEEWEDTVGDGHQDRGRFVGEEHLYRRKVHQHWRKVLQVKNN